MKKSVFYDKNAETEFQQFSDDVQKEFRAIIDVLQEEGRLEFPDARKITNDIFEIRIQMHGAYRGFYAYVEEDYVVILHFFQKKQQKTPRQHLALAEKRLKRHV